MYQCIKHAKISSHSVLINDLYAQLKIPYLVVKNKSPRILLWLPPNLLWVGYIYVCVCACTFAATLNQGYNLVANEGNMYFNKR